MSDCIKCQIIFFKSCYPEAITFLLITPRFVRFQFYSDLRHQQKKFVLKVYYLKLKYLM